MLYEDFQDNSLNMTVNQSIHLPIHKSIQDFLSLRNYKIVEFKGIRPVQEVKCAFLRLKKNFFHFDYEEKTNYYFFIVKELNNNYIKQNENNRITFFKNVNVENPKGIYFDFDYNKYKLYAILGKIGKNKEFIFEEEKQILLNREICSVRHSTYDGINYFKLTKKIEEENSRKNFVKFPNSLEKYYVIEIETKKKQSETTIREDGVLSVLYLLSSTKTNISNLFIMIKYSLYFIKETLINYIGKYLRDMIYDFCQLPSDILLDFLCNIGAININSKETKIYYPLRKNIKKIQNLNYKNLIHFIYRNLSNIKRSKAIDKVPFHKFVQLYEKYNMFHKQSEFKINKFTSQTNDFSFMKNSLIIERNDNITKEHKVDINKLLKILLNDLTNFLNNEMNNNKQNIKRFMMESLNRFLTQYTTLKGFFNIDIVINEESMFEFQCFKNKNKNQSINENLFYCVSKTLGLINYIFEFNEGFFHKHFSILDFSYNFNEKNVIHTFPCYNDSSKKNKIRIYDIPFIDKWNFHVATLIMLVYKEKYGFLNLNKNYEEIESQENSQRKFFNLFNEIHELISKEFFNHYEIVLPNFYSFCDRISKYPLDKYNCIDSVCQHFTNISLEILLRDNLKFFCPFNDLYNINLNDFYNKPNLESIFEPYLIIVDDKLKTFLNKKEKKEEFLRSQNFTIGSYYHILKKINSEKIQHSLFLTENNLENEEKENRNKIIKEDDSAETEDLTISIKEISQKKLVKVYKNSPYNISNEKFDYHYLFNLYYFYIYKSMFSLKEKFINFDTIKGFINYLESSVSMSFNDLDNSIIKNAPKEVKDVKKTKKLIKKGIIKDLIIMNKLNSKVRAMNFIFMDYLKRVVYEIMKDEKSGWIKKESNKEYYYMKIGHYLVNFYLYGNCENNIKSFEEFSRSDFYINSGL